MATRGEIIDFGFTSSLAQALDRLPRRKVDTIDSDDIQNAGINESREHLASLREWLIYTMATLANGENYELSEKMVPLSYQDMDLLATIGFKPGPLLLAQFEWATLSEDNIWADLYDMGDNAYKRWNIWEMSPDLASLLKEIDDTDFDLLKSASPHCICIQTDKHFIPQDQQPIAFGADDYWTDYNFPYNVGIVTEDELKALLQDLGRRPQTSEV